MAQAELNSEIRLKDIKALLEEDGISKEERVGMIFEKTLLEFGLGLIDESERIARTDAFFSLFTLSSGAGLEKYLRAVIKVNSSGDPITRLEDIRNRTVARLELDGIRFRSIPFSELMKQAI